MGLAEQPQFTIVLFQLPDGRYVLQRRTKDAPYAPGRLGIFGGRVEEGETPNECIKRELKEETNLDIAAIELRQKTEFIIPSSEDFDRPRYFFLYEAKLSNLDFEVYEGDGAEAYALEELRQRDDLVYPAQYVIGKYFSSVH